MRARTDQNLISPNLTSPLKCARNENEWTLLLMVSPALVQHGVAGTTAFIRKSGVCFCDPVISGPSVLNLVVLTTTVCFYKLSCAGRFVVFATVLE